MRHLSILKLDIYIHIYVVYVYIHIYLAICISYFISKMVNAQRVFLKENSHFLQDRPHHKKWLTRNAFSLKKIAIFFKIAPIIKNG